MNTHKKSSLFFLALLCSGIIFLTFGCIRNPATRKVHTRLLSAESEKKIGEETKKRILEEYQVLESTVVTAYVNEIGQKLAQSSDRPTVDYEFIVLDHDLINAFAAPGGYIFVTKGLLNSIEGESELAMVLGHEIAHVAALHGVQLIQKEMGQNALTILGTIGAALVAGPEAMLMVGQTGELFSSLYLLGYSREKELEADNLGLQYMLRAGYDPKASVLFLQELQKNDPEKLEGWDLYFRSHPATSERIDIIESMIGRENQEIQQADIDRFQKIKEHLPHIEKKERGVINGRVYTNELHQLTLQVPSNWDLGFMHPQSLVSFQTKDNKGEGRLQVISLSSMTTHAESVTQEFAKYNGFKFLSGRNTLYDSGYGYLGRFYGISLGGKVLDLRIFTTIHFGQAYMLMVGAPPESVESYLLDLEQIIRSLHFDYI